METEKDSGFMRIFSAIRKSFMRKPDADVVMPEKRYLLFNPGPVLTSDGVKKALQKPDICHRDSDFLDVMAALNNKLVTVCGGNEDYASVLIAGSGTSAMECCLSLLANSGKKTLVINNGTYSDRIKKILAVHGAKIAEVKFEPFSEINLDAVEKAVRSPFVGAVCAVHHETGTGMLNPVREIGKLCEKYGKMFYVDATSSIAGDEFGVVDFCVDFCSSSANKCIGGIPGLAFVVFKKSSLDALRNAKRTSFYLDLVNLYDHQAKGDTPFTPAVQAIYAFDAAVDELLHESVAKRVEKYGRHANIIRDDMEKLGIPAFLDRKLYSNVLTSYKLPRDINYEKLYDGLKKRSCLIYASGGMLGPRGFRIANIGALTDADINTLLKSFRETIRESREKSSTEIIILAAGSGSRMSQVLKNKPKSLIKIGSQSLLERHIMQFRELGFRNFTVVVGYEAQQIKDELGKLKVDANIRFVYNADYASTGSAYSLCLAKDILSKTDCIILDADILYPNQMLSQLVNSPYENVMLASPAQFTGEEVNISTKNDVLADLGKKLFGGKFEAEAVGIYALSQKAGAEFAKILETLSNTSKDNYEDLLPKLSKICPVFVRKTELPWVEFDFEGDIIKAEREIFPKIQLLDSGRANS